MQNMAVEQKELCEKEADAVAKFIMNLDIKVRKTQLIVKNGPNSRQMNAEYVLGKWTQSLSPTSLVSCRQGFALRNSEQR